MCANPEAASILKKSSIAQPKPCGRKIPGRNLRALDFAVGEAPGVPQLCFRGGKPVEMLPIAMVNRLCFELPLDCYG